jgi:hypothetical protein
MQQQADCVGLDRIRLEYKEYVEREGCKIELL